MKKIVKKKDIRRKKKKKKRNKIKTVFIVLSIFLILMGLLFIYTLSLDDSNSDGALIDDVFLGEMKKLDLTDKNVNKLYHLFLEDSIFKRKYAEGLNKTIESRLYYTYLNLTDDDFEEVRCDDVGLVILYDENNILKALCYPTTYTDEIDTMEKEIRNNSTLGIDASIFKDKYRELFGDVQFDTLDFDYSVGQLMHYDSRSNKYLKYYAESGSVGYDIEGSFKEATLRGRKLKITISYTEEDFDGETTQYDIVYNFEKNKDSNKYIFMNREEI